MEGKKSTRLVALDLLENQVKHLQQMIDLLAGQSVTDKGSNTPIADNEHAALIALIKDLKEQIHQLRKGSPT